MPFTLTKSHILSTFHPLSQTSSPSQRDPFFAALHPNIRWTLLGQASSLAGTRVGIADHNAATFSRLGAKLRWPIKFTVTRVIVDAKTEREPEPQPGQQDAGSRSSGAQPDRSEARETQQEDFIEGAEGSLDEEEDGCWACVELKGEAVRKNGQRYDNDYVWLTRWNDDGKIVEIRSYFDTLLAEQVLDEPDSENSISLPL